MSGYSWDAAWNAVDEEVGAVPFTAIAVNTGAAKHTVPIDNTGKAACVVSVDSDQDVTVTVIGEVDAGYESVADGFPVSLTGGNTGVEIPVPPAGYPKFKVDVANSSGTNATDVTVKYKQATIA